MRFWVTDLLMMIGFCAVFSNCAVSSDDLSSDRSSLNDAPIAASENLSDERPSSSTATLIPGAGWAAGDVTQPEVSGVGVPPIAHWDVVPYQTVNDQMNIGLLAYHINEIEKVSFSVNKGPWFDVKTPNLNPQTASDYAPVLAEYPQNFGAVEEYWVVLDAAQFRNTDGSFYAGPVEIRAIVYPKFDANGIPMGTPIVLQGAARATPGSSEPSAYHSTRHSLIVNVDAAQQLPHRIRYASVNGNDTNDCRSLSTSCRSLGRTIQSSAVNNSIDGLEVRLSEGYWDMNVLDQLGSYSTPIQWLTFTSAEDANPDDVRITGTQVGGNHYSQYKLTRFYNLSIVKGGFLANPLVAQYWMDHVKIYNEFGMGTWSVFAGMLSGGEPAGAYYTDVYQNNVYSGPVDASFGRNIYTDKTNVAGAAAAQPTLINWTVKNVFQLGDAHADLYHTIGEVGPDSASDDVIVYGLRTVPDGSYRTRGFAAENANQTNFAIVNSEISVSGTSFSFCGSSARNQKIDNFIVKKSKFTGLGNVWCTEFGVSPDASMMKNILLDRSLFSYSNGSSTEYRAAPVPTMPSSSVRVIP